MRRWTPTGSQTRLLAAWAVALLANGCVCNASECGSTESATIRLMRSASELQGGQAVACRNEVCQTVLLQPSADGLMPRRKITRGRRAFEEGEKLRAAERARVHERLGYGSFVEYIERLFGYSPRLTFEKLRVAEALEALPQLAAALRQGNVSWSSVRELTRVATRATERRTSQLPDRADGLRGLRAGHANGARRGTADFGRSCRDGKLRCAAD